ncbi:MAG: hypothetical protein ACRCSN_13115 [Dermatophilaceae bacterium]
MRVRRVVKRLAIAAAVGTAAVTAVPAPANAQPLTLVTSDACAPGVVVPSTTEYDGVPGRYFWKLMQCLGRQGGYVGPIDGDLGKNSWAGIQRRLSALPQDPGDPTSAPMYSGAITAAPTADTWAGLQRYASAHSPWNGLPDGDPTPDFYRGLAFALNDLIALRHP